MDSYKSIEELVKVLQTDYDEDAFRLLVERFRPLIFSLYKQFLVKHRLYDADDWFQEASIEIYKALADYKQQQGYFSPYIKLRLRHLIANVLRATSTDKRILNQTSLMFGDRIGLMEDAQRYIGKMCENIQMPELTPEQIVVGQERFQTFMDSLSDFERQVFLLTVMGLPIVTVANRLGKSVRCCQSALDRCRKKLKDLL